MSQTAWVNAGERSLRVCARAYVCAGARIKSTCVHHVTCIVGVTCVHLVDLPMFPCRQNCGDTFEAGRYVPLDDHSGYSGDPREGPNDPNEDECLFGEVD